MKPLITRDDIPIGMDDAAALGEQCGNGFLAKKNGVAKRTKTLQASVDEWLGGSPSDVGMSKQEAQEMLPLLDAYHDKFFKQGDRAEANGVAYERSGLDRAIGLTKFVAEGRESQIARSPDLIKDSLGYQSGRANAADVPPVAVKALMSSIPAVLPHMNSYQARGVLDAYPLNKKPPSPASDFAKSQETTYYNNIRMAQAQALRVLQNGSDRDKRAYQFAIEKLARDAV
jgi:hypothetical protein